VSNGHSNAHQTSFFSEEMLLCENLLNGSFGKKYSIYFVLFYAFIGLNNGKLVSEKDNGREREQKIKSFG